MDLIWDGSRLFVAGPDTRARWHETSPNVGYIGLRFSRAIGPALVRCRADDLRDTTADLENLWASKPARILAEQVAADPERALERWLVSQRNSDVPAQVGTVIFELASRSVPVAVIADNVGMSVRQLHRRCLPLFGYGPQHLSRVLRLERVVAAARSGLTLAEVAATTGFADQAHLSREVRDLVGVTPTRLLRESA